MRDNTLKLIKHATATALSAFLLASGASFAVNLTAGPTTATLPDGSTIPMWGYSCGAVTTDATCAALNPASVSKVATVPSTWSPVVITVPYVATGTSLTINLTNNLSFQPPTPTVGPTAGIAPALNTVPTSLVIVGQLGGGLGKSATYVASPPHAAQGVTWPIANTGATNNPPPQGPRVQSFATEITAVAATTAATCTVPAAGPVSGCAALTWNNLKPGTYLIESGTHPSIQVPMGLYGILVVTAPPTTGTGTAYPAVGTTPAVTYNAEIPLEFSEIDPVQNNAVNAAVNTAGFSETMVWSGQPGGCGNPASATYHRCYPPAVNYTPLYYLINGVAFDKTHAPASLFPVSPAIGLTAGTGNVLVRMVNAGSRMHVPSIVGSLTGATATTAGVPGFSIVAEDGNVAPGVPKVQSDVFMAAGKTYDVMINVPTSATALPVFDRELSLSGNAVGRDTGMLAYLSINGAGLPVTAGTGIFAAAVARADTYNSLAAGQTFSVSDPSRGVIANDTNVYGVQLLTVPTKGTVTLAANGTFTYVPAGIATSDSFTYCANGSVVAATTTTSATCSSGITATVTLGPAVLGAPPIANADSYTSKLATYLSVAAPGVLLNDKDPSGLPLKVAVSTVTPAGVTVTMEPNGGFIATAAAAGTYTFTYQAQNSLGQLSNAGTVTLVFPPPSNLAVTVKDPQGNILSDYRWIIEEDKTFYVDPNKTTTTTAAVPPTFGVNFHTSHMEYVAQGCTGPLSCESGQTVYDANPLSPTFGTHVPAVCNVGNGACVPGIQQTAVNPSQVTLDPSKRYYISILPGDAAIPFQGGALGHTMGGAPVAASVVCTGTTCTAQATGNTCTPVAPATTCTPAGTPAIAVTALVEATPLQPGKLSVSVFEDDFPLNGEQDAGGGIDVLAQNEPGLGGFNIELFDDMGGSGDPTGQMTYDMFNQPLSNSLAGTIDPATGLDACPISTQVTANATTPGPLQGTQQGITGQIVTCPKYESDGVTLSPLAGQAVVANLMPGRFSVVATPGAERIARGEEWLQTNTLDGQKGHDSFIRVGEPSYFQEYGPAGFHVNIGFANPKVINDRWQGVCNGTDLNLTAPNCTNTVTGRITGERMSRTPDQRLYGSGSRDTFSFTQCYVSLGDPDGEDFIFAKCAADGTFTLKNVPPGGWRLSIFDQWNDQLMDGLSTPVNVANGNNQTVNMGDIPVQQWQSNIYTRTFIDDNKDGVYQTGEAGIPLINTTVRYRDGSRSNLLGTDFNGVANFNETFPLFNWYVVEADVTRYKTTGIHVVYDAGGPADGTTCGGNNPPCGTSNIGRYMANTYDQNPLPGNLSVPGAVYCSGADCTGASIAGGPVASSTSNHSTGRIDPPWVPAEGWQGFSGQNNFIEFGKTPYCAGATCGLTAPATAAENGGIHGHVVYASTRPFDDPQMNVQQPWEPLIPHVTVNLYKEGFALDGVTPTLTLVDTTQTSSWDDWAQGFRSDGIPNMNCPGQSTTDLFYFTLINQPNYLNPATPLPYNSQYKCYDGMHNWNQVQPAPYDGMYSFPSVIGMDPTTGKPTGTGSTNGTPGAIAGSNCTICIPNPDSTDPYRVGTAMLPPGKYVVEVVVPPGMEIVKEEDKNILIGDNFIAPVTQQFGGLGNVFIMPDQAQVASAYNANNAQNPTQNLGASPNNQIVPGFVPEPVWPCVGQSRIVPDFISLFPQSKEVAPFAGATRNLCDRKEVTLTDQSASIVKFYIFTSTHIAAKYTGVITDDFTSEFDPFSPTFGEKFSPPNVPVSLKDWAGNEISRVYSDQWGLFNGLTYSTWEVNPPNPTGYSPTMMVTCMNDAGPILDTRRTIVNSSGLTVPNPTYGQMVTDPLFNPLYSQFCYELPFMPGATDYMDTPVVPTSGLVGAGYNNPDCAYPTETPAVSEVDGDGVGPWVSAPGHNITITALGDQVVNNYGYSGPSATTAPFNQKTVTRHYGFGTQCTAPTAGSATCNARSTVTIGVDSDGQPIRAAIVSWSDTQIVATVPTGVPACTIQQQAQYGGSAAQCGELVITAGNGRQSVDAVTVTVGGKAPTHVAASATIQSAIDAAAPGDLIIVDPTCTAANAAVPCTTAGATHSSSAHNEMVLMWKPVRLQGVGAASSIINASAHPAGQLKMDTWRRAVDCLFGLALNGQPNTAANPFDPSNTYNCPTGAVGTNGQPIAAVGPNGNQWNYFSGGPNYPEMVVDRIPMEGILGWDTTVNGNLAEMLQEPSLMGAYEGAGITVLSKGVNIPTAAACTAGGGEGCNDPFGSGAEAAFPDGTTLLTGEVEQTGESLLGDANPICHTSTTNPANPFPGNFQCNPSSIDGLGITNSSQGGGGINVHAWGHNLEIANNRVYNNTGTLSGGMSIGQGESPEAYLNGTAGDSDPGSCFTAEAGQVLNSQFPLNTQLPYCLNLKVNLHNNYVSNNASTGDELFTGTPAGAGGVSICTGADFYNFRYNWICGNLSTGDGGGVGHMGFSWNGDIEHNTFLFNQSTNPSIQSNGGGLLVMGAAPDTTIVVNGVAIECGSVTDADCVPGLSDGAGPGLVINANLLMSNSADAGSGGGIRLQAVNGTDVARFPSTPANWYSVQVTNNIINNNVAGWDGAGVSLEDSLAVTLINNTIASNDTTASSGVLFNTLGAPLASSQSPAPTCLAQNGGTASCPQPAGLVAMLNSPQLTSSFTTGAITCPPGNYAPGTSPTNGTCIHVSYPALYNNIFWQNRTFNISVGPLGTGTLNQQNVVTLTPTLSQTATGQCVTGANYWDIGVRGDTGPTNHGSGYTLDPLLGVLTSTSGYSSTNTGSDPALISQYCNGSRVPPENGGLGWQVPPGIADAVVPNPIFNLTPAATVDEGNNWINMSWGPLSMLNPVTSTGTTNVVLGNYSISSTSPAVNAITCNNGSSPANGCIETINVSGVTTITAPNTDFFGNRRPDPGNTRQIDMGAVEVVGNSNALLNALLSVTPTVIAFGTTPVVP